MSDRAMKRKALFGLVVSVSAFVVTMGIAIWRGNDGGPSSAILTAQATTTLASSGLLEYLVPKFTGDTGIEVRTLVFGTGQVLKNAKRGDADVVLVHDTLSEEAFVAQGHGSLRRDVMYNEFVLVGPDDDPSGVRHASSIADAFKTIAERHHLFVSRGDDSGTHKAELRLWNEARIAVSDGSVNWYVRAGAGAGATLSVAAERKAYILVDRASWVAFENKGSLGVLVENEPPRRNTYGVILVNSKRHPGVDDGDGRTFVNWLTGAAGQAAISAFLIDGQQVYFPVLNPGSGEAAKR